MTRRRYIHAINDALAEEMERDPKVIVFGEDVELAIFGDTRGLLDRFGRDRIRNTPICEATLTGMAVGAAKGLLKQAIRGDDPSFFLEASGRGAEMGEVPDGDHTVPFGEAAVRREGRDVTMVAIGPMVKHALRAAEELAEQGIDVEVVDPRTLVPLDEAGIVESVTRTGRLIVVDEARDRCSAASHIAAVVADKAFHALKAPVKRVCVPDVAMPYAPNAESRVLPNPDKISDVVRSVMTVSAR